MRRIATLMTCHNRKASTIACLDRLLKNTLPENHTLDIFLVDDGSTDGTAQAVNTHYPQVNVITGNGNLYWNGGMQLAWENALPHNADFFLWLNDDVELKENALETLLSTYQSVRTDSSDPVIIGNLCDEKTGELSYGGCAVDKGLLHFRARKLPVSDTVTACDTINGNVVLIPKPTVARIGTLNKNFTHAMGDFDYGLRCTAAGVPIFSTAGFIGTCSNNTISNTWTDPTIPLKSRLAKLKLPTGLPPYEYFLYNKAHTNVFTATFLLTTLYLKVLFPAVWVNLSNFLKGS
jgi:GT2 family glycosyltransferase